MSKQPTKTPNGQAKSQNCQVPMRFILVVTFGLQFVLMLVVGLTSYLFYNGKQITLLTLAALGVMLALELVTVQSMVKQLFLSKASQAADRSEIDQRFEADISVNELGKMAQQLRESLEKFTKVFYASPDPMLLLSLAEGRYIDVNESFLSFFGYEREEVIGSTSSALELGINAEEHNQIRQRLQTEGSIRNLELDCRDKSGAIKTLLLSAETIEIDQQDCILWMGKDITKRKQVEAALKDSEAKLSNILSSAEAVIARFRLFHNQNWTYEYFSSGTETIFGYSPEELQANQQLWISRIHPDDIKLVIPQMFEDIFAGRRTKVEFRFQHRNGTWRWISDTVVPHRDESANCWVVTCVEIDITDRKLAEVAQAQVVELERLNQLKDDFLNMVSHELRTPMTNIIMAIQMLEISLRQAGVFEAKPNRMIWYFQTLQDECKREISLIDDLLNLAHPEVEVKPLMLEKIEPRALILSITEPFVQRLQSQQQYLQLDLTPELPPLTTDISCLERILRELLNNACKYTPPGETITLAARSMPTFLQLSISNSGVELPASELARIFDKFYRVPNNDPYSRGGTGLGLALVKRLVEHLGATIQVESTAGQVTFTIDLPFTSPVI